jgi:hypothetical protein
MVDATTDTLFAGSGASPLDAMKPCTASTATYMLRALCFRAEPPRAYLDTQAEPSTLSDLMSGCRARSYTSYRDTGRQGSLGRIWWYYTLVPAAQQRAECGAG